MESQASFKQKAATETILSTRRCRFCGYVWQPKVPNPKECPRCKRRLDRPPRLRSQRSW